MITAAVLAAYVALLATLGARILARASWPDRMPRLGVLAWQALVINVLAGFVFSVLAVTVGFMGVSMEFAGLLHVCVMNMRAASSSPLGATGIWFAAGAILVLAVRITAVGLRASCRGARTRSRTRATTDLAGRPEPTLGATVIEHAVPYAFSVPGRRGRIVVTSAAVQILGDAELAAVLAHEQAHLRFRHHVVVGTMAALRRAMPFVPAMRVAAVEVARLVELDADDHAVRVAGGHAVRGALAALGRVQIASPALAASAIGVEGRLTRVNVASRVGLLRKLVLTSGVGAGFSAPAAIVLAPAAVATVFGLCQMP